MTILQTPRSGLSRIPPLENGDCLTRDEFARRYEAMPHIKKAELIDGVVYMASPVRAEYHGNLHADLMGWLGYYRAFTPHVLTSDNSTLRLDDLNEPQPDACLFIVPESGGQIRYEDGYLRGAPELVAEIAASSVSHDANQKKNLYARVGVQEYILWRVLDGEIDWFRLRNGVYENLLADDLGVIRSEVFPGLWLATHALLSGQMNYVLQVCQQGLGDSTHHDFVNRLTPGAR